MRLGLFARADDRGLATLSYEYAAHLPVERVLVVREPGSERRGFACHPERFPDAEVVTFDPLRGTLPEAPVREFLAGLDVVLMLETPYDFGAFAWAREAGCRTVLLAMPEFFRWHDGEDRPDVWWIPTRWRQETMPDECRVVEVPVPDPPFTSGLGRTFPTESPLRFLHVAGHRAAADRNGTVSLYQALRKLTQPAEIQVHCQDRRLPSASALPRHVRFARRAGGMADRWDLYRGADVLVLPRRYGGLSLPVLEALAAGLVVIMTDLEPQRSTWPIVPAVASTDRRGTVETPGGSIPIATVDPAALAQVMDMLSMAPGRMELERRRAAQWVADHGWAARRPRIMAELERACG